MPDCQHSWVIIYDDEGEIIGAICSKCGERK